MISSLNIPVVIVHALSSVSRIWLLSFELASTAFWSIFQSPSRNNATDKFSVSSVALRIEVYSLQSQPVVCS